MGGSAEGPNALVCLDLYAAVISEAEPDYYDKALFGVLGVLRVGLVGNIKGLSFLSRRYFSRCTNVMVVIDTAQSSSAVLPKRPVEHLIAAEELLLRLLPKKKDLELLDLPQVLIKSVVNEDGSRTITVHEHNGDDFSEEPLRILEVPNGQGFSVRGSNLSFCRFEGDFSNCDFRFCNLFRAAFDKANLEGAKFQQPFSADKLALANITWPQDESGKVNTRAILYGPRLIGPNLRIFSKIVSDSPPKDLIDLDLSGLDLRKVCLKGAEINFCNLQDTILPEDLTGATIKLDCMEGVDLKNRALSGALIYCPQTLAGNLSQDLSRVTLSGNISGQDWSNHNLTGANLFAAIWHAVGDDGTRTEMPNDLSGVRFPAFLEGIDISRKKINGAFFLRSVLTNVKLPNDVGGADFEGASFVDTNLSQVRFETGNFHNTTFKNCLLPELFGYDRIEQLDGSVKLLRQNHIESEPQCEEATSVQSRVLNAERINPKNLHEALKTLSKGLKEGEFVEMILPIKSDPPHIHVYYVTPVLLLRIDRETESRGTFVASLFRVDEGMPFERMVEEVGSFAGFNSSSVVREELFNILFGNCDFGNTSIKLGNHERIITTRGTSGVGDELDESSGASRFCQNIKDARRILTESPS